MLHVNMFIFMLAVGCRSEVEKKKKKKWAHEKSHQPSHVEALKLTATTCGQKEMSLIDFSFSFKPVFKEK